MKKLLGLVTLLVVLFYAVGFMLPKEYEVVREHELEAGPEAVYAALIDLATWPQWSFWSTEADPDCTWTYSNDDATGRPTVVRWEGPVNGERTLELLDAQPHERALFELTFVDGETRLRSECALRIDANGSGSRVTWVLTGEMADSAVHRWVGLMMDGAVGGALETSLAGLDAYLAP